MKKNITTIDHSQITVTSIENKIYTIRGVQVLIDFDLSKLYGVENRVLKQAVRRNLEKFPDDFMFKLSEHESNELISRGVSQSVIPLGYNTGGAEMFAFTEQGVAMLATVLKSAYAVSISIAIMRAFVAMRHCLMMNNDIVGRIDRIENKLSQTDIMINELFREFKKSTAIPKQGIFFNGQIFDAYVFLSELIKTAKKNLALIDNFIDETVLTLLDKRQAGVQAIIYTQIITPKLQLDIEKHNSQYDYIDVRPFNKAHDRFLIVDNQVYHIGASLKDLGKKWFAFSLMRDITPDDLLSRI